MAVTKVTLPPGCDYLVTLAGESGHDCTVSNLQVVYSSVALQNSCGAS